MGGRRSKGLKAGTSRACSAYTWCLIFGYNLEHSESTKKKWMSRFHTLASEDFSRMQHGNQDVLNSSGDLVYKAENHSVDEGRFY